MRTEATLRRDYDSASLADVAESNGTRERLDIIAIPDTPWDRIVWTNRQHVMRRLPALDPAIRVLYVAPPRVFTRRLRTLSAGPTEQPSLWTTAVAERVWVVQPFLPLPRRWLARIAPGLAERLMIAVARRASRRLGFERPCVWSYTPIYEELAGAFGEAWLVYDVVNDYAAMPYYRRTVGPHVADLDRRLTARADLVFVVDDYLYEQRSEWNSACRLVGNAGDVRSFGGARELIGEPKDMRELSRPRVGFHGTLTGETLDLPLLGALAERRPDWTFVLIGPEKDPAVRAMLGRHEHVHFLGHRGAAELPAYLAAFDLLLIPYRRAPFVGLPLKVYEGLAAGLPVVATGPPELDGEPGITVAGADAGELETAISAILSASPAPVPLEALEAHSWEAKALRQRDFVRELLPSRSTGAVEPMISSSGVSVTMAAHNEEQAIRRCLESVHEWAAEIIVVDAASTDGTANVARAFGATVIPETNKLMLNLNKNIAIDHANHEWILVLDPDERVSVELAQEIRRVVAESNGDTTGYWLPRRDRELGRELSRTSLQLRFFRRGAARFPCEHIHEMVALSGPAGQLRGVLAHEPRQSLFEYVHKRNLYSEHRARFLYETGAPFRLWRLLLRPPTAFFRAYLVRGAWRDGIQGLIIACSAVYGVFLQEAKLWQFHRMGLADEGASAPDSSVTEGGAR
jgi:glycosyltransferase involved in cell wall biosynthesis